VGESYWLSKKPYTFKTVKRMKSERSCDSGTLCRGRLLVLMCTTLVFVLMRCIYTGLQSGGQIQSEALSSHSREANIAFAQPGAFETLGSPVFRKCPKVIPNETRELRHSGMPVYG